MTHTPLRLVRVVWEDASTVDEGPWVHRAPAAAPDVILFDQVGWLLELTADHAVLCSALGKDLMAPRERIPTGMIRSIFEFLPDSGVPVAIPRRKRVKK